MQLYKDLLLSQDRHRELLRAVEQDRLARLTVRQGRSLWEAGEALIRFIGVYLSF